MKVTYRQAMDVRTQAEADATFENLVQQCMEGRLCGRAEAERIQRANLGYFAGYYSNETREIVERLYRCAHPIFGPIAKNGPPTAKEAFELGLKLGAKSRTKRGHVSH